MNLWPEWGRAFELAGWNSNHWSSVADARASDRWAMGWTQVSNSIVHTHDLDFGGLLAATGAAGPSVVQLRSEEVRPSTMASTAIAAMRAHQTALEDGALLTIDPRRSRLLLLPLRKG